MSGNAPNKSHVNHQFYISSSLLVFLVINSFVYHQTAQPVNVYFSLTLLLLTLLSMGVIGYFFIHEWLKPLQTATRIAQCIAENKLDEAEKIVRAGEATELTTYLTAIGTNLRESTAFAEAIGEGKYDGRLSAHSVQSGLSKALSDMRDTLVKVAEEERVRSWSVNGIAQFSELFRDHQNASLPDVSLAFVRLLVQYLTVNQGGVYLLNTDTEYDPHLELTACYAYERKKFVHRRLEIGQSLVGQCFLERAPIYLTDVPADYVKITSGLGEATPRTILLVPIETGEQVLGVVELAAFTPLEPYQIQLVERVSDSFAAILAGVKVNTRTQKLLAESQQVTHELQNKEEILRQNSEELLATQEELSLKVREIEQETAMIRSILDAINKTNASLELDLHGNIVAVNDMYLSLMEYRREDIIGKSEKTFVASDELHSQRYDIMWDSIKTGSFNSGEFRRVSKSGKELWLTGTYSPICDVTGKPYKIVQFAQFTTEQKERELELVSKITAINQSISILEINLDGLILSANPYFMKEFGFRRNDIRSKLLADLLDPAYSQSDDYRQMWTRFRAGEVVSTSLAFRTKEGENRYFISNFSPSRNLAGDIHKVVLALIDITEQYRLKEQLSERLVDEKRKNAILELQAEVTDDFIDELSDILLRLEDNANQTAIDTFLQGKRIPVIELNAQGTVQLANRAAGHILGEDPRGIQGQTMRNYLHFRTNDEQTYFWSKLGTPEFVQIKAVIKTKQNQHILFNVYMAPRFLPETNAYTTIMLIMNVESTAIND